MGNIFIHTVRNFRLCWIGGRYGGGKTSFALRLAIEFLERGWAKTAYGNFPSVVFDPLPSDRIIQDCVIVLDEAGVFMTEKLLDKSIAFLRKRNVTLFMSSVLAPPTRGRTLEIQRTFNFQQLGLPVWSYVINLRYMNQREKYTCHWYNPSEIYGLYDTSHVAVDDGGIIDALDKSVQSMVSRESQLPSAEVSGVSCHGSAASQSQFQEWLQGLDEMRRSVESQYEAASRVEEALSVLATTRRRGRR